MSRFKFDTLSPDDTILEAQKRATGSAEPSSGHGQQQQFGAASQSTRNQDTASITNGELLDICALMQTMQQCGHSVVNVRGGY